MTVSVDLSTILPADADRVFAALTEPERLNKWFTSQAVVDLSVGGRYSNADGDEGYFREVAHNRRILFTWDNPRHSPGTLVEFTLSPASAGRTELAIHHTGIKSREEAWDMELGWKWMLDRLTGYLSGALA